MSPQSFDLTNKRTIVVGATDAYAGAIAYACAEAGSDVFVTNVSGDVEEAFELRRLAKRIEALGRRARADAMDVSLPSAVQVGVRQIAKALEGIELAVIAVDAPFSKAAESTSDSEWAKTLAANLSAVFFLCRAVAREMRGSAAEADSAEPQGRIVVLLPDVDPEVAQQAAYVASRAGADALVGTLALEWAPGVIVRGIHVSKDAEVDSVKDEALKALVE